MHSLRDSGPVKINRNYTYSGVDSLSSVPLKGVGIDKFFFLLKYGEKDQLSRSR